MQLVHLQQDIGPSVCAPAALPIDNRAQQCRTLHAVTSMFTLGSAAFSAAAAAMRLLTASLSKPHASAPVSSSESSCAKADGFLGWRSKLGLGSWLAYLQAILDTFLAAQHAGPGRRKGKHRLLLPSEHPLG